MKARRRTPMQVSIEMILEAHGHGLLEQYRRAFTRHDGEFFVKIECSSWQPFIIQSGWAMDGTGELAKCVAVAHLRRIDDGQIGEVLKDPQILFAWDTWEALEITMPTTVIHFGRTPRTMGGYQAKYVQRDGQMFRRPRFKAGVGELTRVWAKSLREQGFAKPARARVTARLYQCHLDECAGTDDGDLDAPPDGWLIHDDGTTVCRMCQVREVEGRVAATASASVNLEDLMQGRLF